MATQKVTAVAQAAQTLAQPVKTRRAPGAGRATKKQGQAVSVTWDQIPALMKKATKADDQAVASWVSLTDRLWVLGVRPSDFEVKDDDAKGLARFSETFRRIRDLVVGSYTEKAQGLIKSPTLSLGPDARSLKTVEEDRLGRHLRTICAYLKKLETKDGAPGHQATFAETLVKELKEMKDRIKRAKEKRITFSVMLVNEAIDVVIAELT
jgi:hypothetical protein